MGFLKLNLAKMRFSKVGDPFAGVEVCDLNCYVGDQSLKVRRQAKKVDRSQYLVRDKSSYIFAKKNIEALRR